MERFCWKGHVNPGKLEEYAAKHNAMYETHPEMEELMRAAFESMNLSARSYDRILRVARTIADLAGSAGIESEHIAEAIQYRTYDLSVE